MKSLRRRARGLLSRRRLKALPLREGVEVLVQVLLREGVVVVVVVVAVVQRPVAEAVVQRPVVEAVAAGELRNAVSLSDVKGPILKSSRASQRSTCRPANSRACLKLALLETERRLR